MKKILSGVVIGLATVLIVPPAISNSNFTIDSVECADGSNDSDCVVHVEGTCADGTHGEGNFFPWQTWGEVQAAFALYCEQPE